jgi:hypothetical protein
MCIFLHVLYQMEEILETSGSLKLLAIAIDNMSRTCKKFLVSFWDWEMKSIEYWIHFSLLKITKTRWTTSTWTCCVFYVWCEFLICMEICNRFLRVSIFFCCLIDIRTEYFFWFIKNFTHPIYILSRIKIHLLEVIFWFA